MAGKLYRGTGGSCPFIMYPITSGKEGGTGNPCRPSGEIKYRHQYTDYTFLPG